MRYLEQCVSSLKASHQARQPLSIPTDYTTPDPRMPYDQGKGVADDDEQLEDEGGSEDEEMAQEVSPTSAPSCNQRAIGISPSIHPSPYGLTPTNASPTFGSFHHRRPSAALSYTSSGHFYPQSSPDFSVQSSHTSTAFSSLTSPALRPQPDHDDHEASSALLMLNSDRRSWTSASGGRGMSVKELLSN